MKLQCVIALLLGMGATASAAEATALVLYTEPPTSYVNVLEVVSIASSNVAYSQVVLPNGQREEIPRAGILAVVALPPGPPGIATAAEANESAQKIRALEEKFPQYRGKLDAALAAWNTALAYARQHATDASAHQQASKAGPDLVVDQITYHDVALVSFNGDEVGISHADGAATIPAAKLSSAQIAVLNATNAKIHINVAEIGRHHPPPVAATASQQPPVSAPVVPTVADDAEIIRAKQAVITAEATLRNLQAEQAALIAKVKATPNRLRDSPDYLAAVRRKNGLFSEINLAEAACSRAAENLDAAERSALTKVLNSNVDAYRAAAMLPAEVSNWTDLRKKWADEVTERTKSADAAEEMVRKARAVRANPSEIGRLDLVSDAESKKLKIAKDTLHGIETRIVESERKAEADKRQIAETQRQNAEKTEAEKAIAEFKSLPAVNDQFVKPEALASTDSPTYEETIEFINSRLNSPFLAPTKIGFGEQLRKIIWRGDGFAYAFDPADLNADVKYSIGTGPGASNSIFLECRNRKGLIQRWTRSSVDPQVLFGFKVYTGDEVDTEKMAKAFSHLILMFGGKSDAF